MGDAARPKVPPSPPAAAARVACALGGCMGWGGGAALMVDESDGGARAAAAPAPSWPARHEGARRGRARRGEPRWLMARRAHEPAGGVHGHGHGRGARRWRGGAVHSGAISGNGVPSGRNHRRAPSGRNRGAIGARLGQNPVQSGAQLEGAPAGSETNRLHSGRNRCVLQGSLGAAVVGCSQGAVRAHSAPLGRNQCNKQCRWGAIRCPTGAIRDATRSHAACA